MSSRFFGDALRVLYGASLVVRCQVSELQRSRGALAQLLVTTGRPKPTPEDGNGKRGARAYESVQVEDQGMGKKQSTKEASSEVESIKSSDLEKRQEAAPGGDGSENHRGGVSRGAGVEETSKRGKKGRGHQIKSFCSQGVPEQGENEGDLKFLRDSDKLSRDPFPEDHKKDFMTSRKYSPRFEWVARERNVPESPFSRLVGFGSLAAGLALGAASEGARRILGYGEGNREKSENRKYSAFITDANAERLARSLSRMRGAALKLGQMLSIQDDKLVPPQVLRALERVRQGADIMPKWQLDRVLVDEFKDGEWMKRLDIVEFDPEPIAAASIGQVHRAVYCDPESGTRRSIAMKIQYPGVASSIGSDISNLKNLANYTNMLPKSFFLDEALAAAKQELERECDYILEAENQTRFRSLILCNEETRKDFYVPEAITRLTTKRILTSEFVRGVPIDQVESARQRNIIAEMLLRLIMLELFTFRFMQTDPNFSNFLFDAESEKIMLVDHGATREYPMDFVNTYLRLIQSCAEKDRQGILFFSTQLGFLTGEESKTMLDAHVKASMAVGEPFAKEHRGGYSFKDNNIAVRTAEFGKTMLRQRLCPPPQEAYSLHRRLSGAFLMCMRLGATVDAAAMLENTIAKFNFEEADNEVSVDSAI